MSVIIETPNNNNTEWGVSFTSHNPESFDYVECASYLDAERLHIYLNGLSEQIAIRKSEIFEMKQHVATETEPLRREVTVLVKALTEISTFPRYRMPADIAKEALSDTQATALAYEREAKAKALEEFIGRVNNTTLLPHCAFQQAMEIANSMTVELTRKLEGADK